MSCDRMLSCCSDAGRVNSLPIKSHVARHSPKSNIVPIEGVYGKKRQRFKCTLRPKQEWIPISVPPIIDQAIFHAAAGRARENEAFSPRNLQEGGYLLRRLVRCGRCGCSCSALTSKQTYGGKGS